MLQPLPMSVRPWASISMDFITNLPKVDEFSSIMVVVDRFSKYAMVIPCKMGCMIEVVIQHFFKHVVK